jgi:two-component system, OmpR family, KDP operon response regulator KdpE
MIPSLAPTALLVEDDVALRHAMIEALAQLHMPILESGTGADALKLAAEHAPTLIILDLGLPDCDGRDVCAEIRRGSDTPILVVSARDSEAEKVHLLDLGADDYIVKPFGNAELVARVQALLRRAARNGPLSQTPFLRSESVTVDIAQRKVTRDGSVVRLTPIEWSLLEALARDPGRTLTHQQLFDRVWNREFGNPQQYLRVYMTHLRRKIEPEPTVPRWIVTEPGVGYRLEPDG